MAAGMQNENRLTTAQNMMWYTIGSTWYLVSQWLISVLAIRLGSLGQGGTYYAAVNVTSFFYVLCTFGIRVFQVSDATNRYSPSTYISTRILTSLAGFVAFLLFALAGGTSADMWTPILYMGYRLTEAMIDVLAGEQQRAWRMDRCAVSFFLRGTLTLVGFVVTLLPTGSVSLAVGTMVMLGSLVMLLYDLPAVIRGKQVNLMPSLRRSLPLLKEATPLVLNLALMTLLAVIPRYFLERFYGEEVVGIYGAVAMPAVMIQAMAGFIYTPLVNPLTALEAAGNRRGMHRLLAKGVLALLGLMAVTLLGASGLGRWGLTLLYGEEMAQHALMLIPVLLSAFCIAMVFYFDIPMTVQRRMKTMTAVHAISCLVSLGLSLWLIPTMGIAGVNLVLILTAGGDALTLGLMAFRR